MNERPRRQLTDARHRGLVIIWGAQVFSLILFLLLTQLVRVDAHAGADQTLLLVLAGSGLTAVSFSFVLKPRLIEQAAAKRRPDLITTAYILAFALCESCALFGVLVHFITGARAALYFFVPAALGLVLHFPRRRHIEEAAVGGSVGSGPTR